MFHVYMHLYLLCTGKLHQIMNRYVQHTYSTYCISDFSCTPYAATKEKYYNKW